MNSENGDFWSNFLIFNPLFGKNSLFLPVAVAVVGRDEPRSESGLPHVEPVASVGIEHD